MKQRGHEDAATGSGLLIELDPEAAAVLKRVRNRRLHVEQIPRLRLIGFGFFAFGVGLHNWLLLDQVSWPAVFQFAAVLVGYGLLSWFVLHRIARTRDPVPFGEAFLVLDIAFLAAAVYLSGGERSWIYFLILFRVADQAASGLRRALVFTHLCVGAYAAMLVLIVVVDRRPVALDEALAKTLFLYLGAWYVSLCALPVERRRRSIRTAIRTSRDLIARLRTAMAALETSQLRAAEAAEAKGRFLATMSHELRTPLTAVIGGADLLAASPLDREQRELIRMVQRGAQATLRLVSDVLDVSALDQGSLDLERLPFAPATTLREVAAELEGEARRKGLELETSVGADVPETIVGDPRRTRQLVGLLADNAVKFTSAGRVTLRCERVVEASGPPRLRWSVDDTGIGFDPDSLPRLMQDFAQADSSASRRYSGAGLGLALARRLVERLGGEIEATSAPGQGSTFRVDLPYHPAQGQTPPAP